VVVIPPEARVQPQQVPLEFQVSADGASDVVSQTASVAAWVRALPNQPIRLTMRLVRLEGSGGLLSAAALVWTSVRAALHRRRSRGVVHHRRFCRRRLPGPGGRMAKVRDSRMRRHLATRRPSEPAARPLHRPGGTHRRAQLTVRGLVRARGLRVGAPSSDL
jgi:hypothetical protein